MIVDGRDGDNIGNRVAGVMFSKKNSDTWSFLLKVTQNVAVKLTKYYFLMVVLDLK